MSHDYPIVKLSQAYEELLQLAKEMGLSTEKVEELSGYVADADEAMRRAITDFNESTRLLKEARTGKPEEVFSAMVKLSVHAGLLHATIGELIVTSDNVIEDLRKIRVIAHNHSLQGRRP